MSVEEKIKETDEVEEQEEELPKSEFEAVDSVLKDAKTFCILTHRSPDPDAIGSIMFMQWAIQKKYGIMPDAFYEGEIDHPQNMALVNLLDPNMKPIDEFEGEYDVYILVDTIPSNAGVGKNKISFNLCIDHHKESPNGSFDGLFVNLKAGSAVSTIWALVDFWGLKFKDSVDADSRVATAVMVGIATDTENMM